MKDSRKTLNYAETTLIETSRDNPSDTFKLEPYLVILSGLGQGKQFKLSRLYNTFGRTAGVDILINDSKVSREHGAFIIHPDCIILVDNNSTNGCFVNGIRVTQHQIIGSSARIEIGNTLMKVEYKKESEVDSEKSIFRAAYTDHLTSLLNRRSFMKQASEEFSLCKINNKNLAIIMCDIDFFKQINDTFGHIAGDHILKDLANILRTRKEDIVARYGGEEFIMLIRNTDNDSISTWAERIRKSVEQFNFSFQDEGIAITISVGVCLQDGNSLSSLESIIKKADDALYIAKKNGRNRVEFA